ncbi:unnamed protein product [Prunus armeniaca]|uniref:Uncharacterized protein n=1 Tax=Prunus armeniaca TaxID=36596 RepID=A0A6J5XJF2_PRUAR|nr:unnamed protein product [Prunus armeniaca]
MEAKIHFWNTKESIRLGHVAQCLRVNPEAGVFFFDSSYRPVLLAQQYIGISEQNFTARIELQNGEMLQGGFSFLGLSFVSLNHSSNVIISLKNWYSFILERTQQKQLS